MTAFLAQFWPVLAAEVVLAPFLAFGALAVIVFRPWRPLAARWRPGRRDGQQPVTGGPVGHATRSCARPGNTARTEAGGTAMAKVPNTISDAQMAALRRKAEKASTESPFSKRNVARRQASSRQKDQAQNN